MTSNNHDTPEYNDLDTDVMTKSAKPPMYAIILHNDDYTTMEFVVWVLVSVLNLPINVAHERMMAVHQEGQASVAILPKEVAEMKVEQIRQLAEQEEYPLLVTLEKQ